MKIEIFVEGGGKKNRSLQKECRREFGNFFARADVTKPLSVYACGSRSDAYRRFCIAHKESTQNSLVLLLVDSEEPVTTSTCWEHVRNRQEDQWQKPTGAKEEQLFFMVQMMESWLLADTEALKLYFGNRFKINKIPNSQSVEEINHPARALKNATKDCNEPYSKGKSSFKLLGRINPKLVMQKSTHAQDLFNTLISKEK
ncbi:hypothetical protein MNBD_PLANCTO02-2255 [hydrothermal vent metagenome]|uniref:DUF4276 domain-containing protein n=1 Tax=hydrothermal vent metagenome TaxID=652676 RepID=A0A3B1E0Q0_9ZZZZ